MLIRGWTSEVKAFQLVTNKDGSFHKIEKGFHLALNEKPLASVIDAIGLHAVTINNEGDLIKLWTLSSPQHPVELTVDSCQIGIDHPKYCAIATLKLENERLRTVVVVASGSKMVLLDRGLKVVKEFEGVAVEQLYCFGASRSAVFGSYSAGKLAVWDFTKLAN